MFIYLVILLFVNGYHTTNVRVTFDELFVRYDVYKTNEIDISYMNTNNYFPISEINIYNGNYYFINNSYFFTIDFELTPQPRRFIDVPSGILLKIQNINSNLIIKYYNVKLFELMNSQNMFNEFTYISRRSIIINNPIYKKHSPHPPLLIQQKIN